MMAMDAEATRAWLAGLKPGDKVAVFENYGRSFLFERVVERVTPSGRIYCKGGETFKADGYLYGSPAYRHRSIQPVPATTE